MSFEPIKITRGLFDSDVLIGFTFYGPLESVIMCISQFGLKGGKLLMHHDNCFIYVVRQDIKNFKKFRVFGMEHPNSGFEKQNFAKSYRVYGIYCDYPYHEHKLTEDENEELELLKKCIDSLKHK